MLSIPVTAIERQTGRLIPAHLDAALRAVEDDGYVALTNAVDTAHMDTIYARMLADIELLRRRRGMTAELDPNVSPCRRPEFLFDDVLFNPLAAEVMAAVMGPTITNGYYQANVTYPFRGDQRLHVDMKPLKPGEWREHPCDCMVMNVPLVDFTIENGATEVWPGSHRSPRAVGEFWINDGLRDARRAVRPPERAVMPRGSVLLRDIRLWHRGTHNHTTVIRPMVALICTGGFNPALDRIESRPGVGRFPASARPFFDRDTPIRCNVEFVNDDGEELHLNLRN